MPKLIRITTVPMALRYLLPGQMKYIKEHGFDVVMISADGKERQEVITNEGCPHIIVPLTRKITPFTDFICLWKLVKIFKKEKPDIVHTHTPKAGLLGMLAAKIARVKVRIHTVAGLPLMVEKGFKFILLKNIERLTYWAANHVWPNSYSLLNYIKEQNLTTEKKLKIIGRGSSNGIDIERFDPRSLDKNIQEEVKKNINYIPTNFYLLNIGRLVKDKGIIELINAFKSLQIQYPKTKLILVGKFEADLDPLPVDILEEIKVNPDIIHINFTPNVEYYISLANLFVFTSHREGFPNVLLQSGMLKLPIICTEIVGNIDIVENNTSGLLFSVGDTEAMKNKIIFAMDHLEIMRKMSEKLYQSIINSFKRENVWDSILKEYINLISLKVAVMNHH